MSHSLHCLSLSFFTSLTSLHSQSIHMTYKTFTNLNRPSILFYRSTWGAITEMWRRRHRFTSLFCLSSLVSLFFTSVTLCSSSKSLFPHFIGPSTLRATYKTLNNLSIIFNCSHSLYIRHTKPWQTSMASQLYFIVLAVHTRDVRNHDRLEWLLDRIISFWRSIHAMYETMTDYHQCGAYAQACPNKHVIHEMKAYKITFLLV